MVKGRGWVPHWYSEMLQEWAGTHRWNKCNIIGCSIRRVTDQNRDFKPIGWPHLLVALLLLLIVHLVAFVLVT